MNRKHRRQILRDDLFFISPMLLIYTLFFMVPMVLGVVYSFTNWDALHPNWQYVGLENYIKSLTHDEEFFKAATFTIQYVFFGTSLCTVLGLLIAMLVNSDIRTRNFTRVAVFLPNVVSAIVIGFIWKFIYGNFLPEIGRGLGSSFLQIDFLHLFNGGMLWVVLVPTVWQSIGFNVVVYIAGLQSIPSELHEAMLLDSSSAWQRFRHLILPFLVPSIYSTLFINLTGGLKAYDLITSLTGGGPIKLTHTIAYNLYVEAFNKMEYGYASAKCVLFAIGILGITLLQTYFMKSREVTL